MPHANFAEVTWMIFVKVDPVVMHASSIPAASWVLAVLTDATVAVAHVAPEFPGLLLPLIVMKVIVTHQCVFVTLVSHHLSCVGFYRRPQRECGMVLNTGPFNTYSKPMEWFSPFPTWKTEG